MFGISPSKEQLVGTERNGLVIAALMKSETGLPTFPQLLWEWKAVFNSNTFSDPSLTVRADITELTCVFAGEQKWFPAASFSWECFLRGRSEEVESDSMWQRSGEVGSCVPRDLYKLCHLLAPRQADVFLLALSF